MTERLSKQEWTDKIYRDILVSTGTTLPEYEYIKWWWLNSNIYTIKYRNSLRLKIDGFNIFNMCKIEFVSFDVKDNPWVGNVMLGLSKMPCPFYIHLSSEPKKFYIADKEYAFLLQMLDVDFNLFSRTFLEEQ